ncbi:hypothetical protein B9Z19DRAFT_570033 [Tuber borchii]|uniref:Secreted protein n=1 Tax=Tuber borchii TaxID=42251 RepID=A0A2T6ZCE9_TUBBO|nr:hypothetical protein B9Z19DRAFT_570033 [Tuber borchii]
MVPHCVVLLLVWVIVFSPNAVQVRVQYDQYILDISLSFNAAGKLEPFPQQVKLSKRKEGVCWLMLWWAIISDLYVLQCKYRAAHTFSQAAPATIPCFCQSTISKLAIASPPLLYWHDTCNYLLARSGLDHNTVRYYTCTVLAKEGRINKKIRYF